MRSNGYWRFYYGITNILPYHVPVTTDGNSVWIIRKVVLVKVSPNIQHTTKPSQKRRRWGEKIRLESKIHNPTNRLNILNIAATTVKELDPNARFVNRKIPIISHFSYLDLI